MLDLDVARQVRLGEPRVGREVREDVARVSGHDLRDEATPEEQRAEARQAQHHERELRVATPPGADQVTGRGRPSGVVGDDVDGVAGPDV